MDGTEAIIVNESGASFGPFSPDRFFYMEKSDVYRKLGPGFSTVEFLLLDRSERYIFVEAKSSAPKPNKEDKTDFNTFISEVSEKFQDSYHLFLASVAGRRHSSDIGQDITKFRVSSAKIGFVLVIPGHKLDWLPPLNEALKMSLRKITRLWNIDVAVMNEELAREHKLIA